jgi:hypothetical protein
METTNMGERGQGRVKMSNDGISEDLYRTFERYVFSHVPEALRSTGAGPEGELSIRVVPGSGTPVVEAKAPEVRVTIPESAVMKTLAMCRGFHWSNGVAIIPTFRALLQSPAIRTETASAGRPEVVSLEALSAARSVGDTKRHLGNLCGALRLIGLAGWVVTEGTGEGTRFWLTEAGLAAARAVRKHGAVFDRVQRAITHTKQYHLIVRRHPATPAAVEELKELVALEARNWGIEIEGATPTERRGVRHLIEFLDASLLGPVMVALSMPEHRDEQNRTVEAAPPVFEMFGADGTLDLRTIDSSRLDVGFLDAAFDLLERHQMVSRDPSARHRVKLLDWGRTCHQVVSPAAALIVSYLRSYEHVESLLFDDPDPLNMSSDSHVDRVMNIWGSSGAGSGPMSVIISDKILKRLFDELPLESQPAGLADMGCGDGTSLKRLADYVIQHTKRGRALDRFPLTVIGADYNESSRRRARETLTAFASHPHVRTAVVHADVSNPDAYNETVKALGFEVPDGSGKRPVDLRDLVHTFMFLVHNRILTVRSEGEAREVIRAAIRRTDRAEIMRVVNRANRTETRVPDSDAALEELVISQFRTSFSEKGRLVPGSVVAADFIRFLSSWRPHVRFAFVALESHNPWAEKMVEPAPASDEDWVRAEKLPHVFNWGMHFHSAQYLLPFEEYCLAMLLGGFEPPGGEIYGSIHPPGMPAVDGVDDYRFFSVSGYVPRVG